MKAIKKELMKDNKVFLNKKNKKKQQYGHGRCKNISEIEK